MLLNDWIEQSLRDLATTTLPLPYESAAEAHALPSVFHKDPAGRILVAGVCIHRLTQLTVDERILHSLPMFARLTYGAEQEEWQA